MWYPFKVACEGRRDIRQDVRMRELKKVEKTLKKLLTSET